jgi:hypothetical protein
MKRIHSKVPFSRLAFPYTVSLLAFLITLSSCTDKAGKKSSILIGIAEVNYTPEVGLDLVGNYRGDDYASRGVHDSLYARAIVAQDKDKNKAAILTVDICELGKESVNFMRAEIASKTDIPAGNIMIMATHTHSGPPSELTAPKSKEYLLKAASAVVLANERLAPSILAVGRSTEDRISHNRRLKCIDGTTHMCWEKFDSGFVIGPLGPKDPEVITLSILQQGKPVGVIVNFGCHVTTLTGDNWLYTADYPGYMIEAIRKIKGKDYMPMFFNGPCGNVTQVDYRVGFPSNYQECQRIGYLLGVAALEAIENETIVGGDKVAVSREYVPLDKMDISDERLAWAEKLMKKVEKEGMPPMQKDGIPDAMYAKNWIEMRQVQNQIDSLEVMVVRIGDVAFAGLNSEVFAEFGMDIKSKSPFKNTMVTGLTNDSRGYFPTEVAFTQGPAGFTPYITGYETTPGSTSYEIGSGEKMAESAVNQLTKIF